MKFIVKDHCRNKRESRTD